MPKMVLAVTAVRQTCVQVEDNKKALLNLRELILGLFFYC